MVLGLFLSGNAFAETWTCENHRFGKVMYDVKDTEIVLSFPNNDGRTFKITKDPTRKGLFNIKLSKYKNCYISHKHKFVEKNCDDKDLIPWGIISKSAQDKFDNIHKIAAEAKAKIDQKNTNLSTVQMP